MTQDETWLLSEKYDGEKCEAFFADCDRLKNGEPLAYVIGSIPFVHTKIYLDSHPLIPRAETEFWVEKIISEMRNTIDQGKASINVLDLCAGSGCIGVAVLKDVRVARVDFVEIDAGHHPTIQKNIFKNMIDAHQTCILGGDLFEHVSGHYDYILTNPPYIDPAHDRAEESVKRHEPKNALYGGVSGTEIIFRIIDQGPNYLTDGGVLVIEHEPEQSMLIQEYAAAHGLLVQTHVDQFNTERYTHLTRKDTSLVSQ